jgi:hypothetical protein
VVVLAVALPPSLANHTIASRIPAVLLFSFSEAMEVKVVLRDCRRSKGHWNKTDLAG